jgi:microcystin-dependent protein
MSDPFLGEIQAFGFNFAPRGWAQCDGQLLPINQNSALFSLLGTTYGGDGRTTFALPDLRGRTALHEGQGPGLSPRQLGQRSGQETTSLSVQNLPPHGHAIRAKEEGNTEDPTGHYVAGDGTNAFGTGADITMAADSVGNTGGGLPHDNMQPYLTINFCIALQGIYPSRS